VSHKGNPVLVWNYLGRSKHKSEQKHKIELRKRGIKEFEIPLWNLVRMKIAAKDLFDYVKFKRSSGHSLKALTL
jgi:hypothetical protein